MGTNEWNDDITFSIAMNPHVDKIYREIFPVESITRLTRDLRPHILDQEFHIDTIIKLTNGMTVTAQEKVRREKYINYQEFTLEYNSNNRGTQGEYMKLCTDVYVYGYGNPETGLSCVYVFKPIDVKMAIMKGELEGILQQNQYHSTANFYAYPFKKFKEEWFVYKKPYSQGELK
jgi:hypothetical protein